jgi:predicted small metal-binding protein
MLSLACGDVGVDCDYVAKGETEVELWRDGPVPLEITDLKGKM